MERRDLALLVAGILVAAMLGLVLVYPPAFSSPTVDDDARYGFSSAHESTPAFEEHMEDYRKADGSTELRVVAYDDLSGDARRAFDRARADTDSDGEWGRGTWRPDTCRPMVLGCESTVNSAIPPELSVDSGDGASEAQGADAIIVRTEDGRYLFWTADYGDLSGTPLQMSKDLKFVLLTWLTLPTYIVFLLVFAVLRAPKGTHRRLRTIALGSGLGIAWLGVAAPHVALHAGLSWAPAAATLLAVCVAIGTIIGVLTLADQRDRRHDTRT